MSGVVFRASKWVAGKMFGNFEDQEFLKFVRMGIVFGLTIGAYWTIRVLKNSLFMLLTGGKEMIPWAKTVSLIVLIPTVAYYTVLLNRNSRERMFYMLPMFYGVMTALFAVAFAFAEAPKEVIAARVGWAFVANYVLAFSWFVFVESFGSLAVSLFWAFATEVTLPESAKRGFSFVVALGNIGSVVGPKLFTSLPKMLGFHTSAAAVFGGALMMFGIYFAFKSLVSNTPRELLASYHGKPMEKDNHEEEPGFLEGLRIFMSHNYLIGIFGAIFVFEFIATLIDYKFNGAVYEAFSHDNHALHQYLGDYGSMVNLLTLVCLLLGANNITRLLGVGVSLALVPVLIGGGFAAFLMISHVEILRLIMVGSKAVNYALTGPAMKQLYIPTSHDVRFKAQAWIETFGSRASKEAGSLYNIADKMIIKATSIDVAKSVSSYLGFALIALWFGISVYLGRVHKAAIRENKIVC